MCETMSDLGDRLSELRLDYQERQKDIADMLHVTNATVSNYETGTHLPPVDVLCQFADHFHVTTDYLLGRTRCRTSADALNKSFTDQINYGELIEILEKLPQEKKNLLWELIHDMQISNYMKQRAQE